MRSEYTDPGNLFVITGGPGSGKTTLLAALKSQGFDVSEEVGRRIIRQQAPIDGRALPWRDPALYAELMLSWEIGNHEAASAAEPCLFDRGVPDVIGYLRLTGIAVPPHVIAAADRYRYSRRVFIAPPWPEIFAPDAERRQSFAEAVRTYRAMAAAYAEWGYDLVELPRAPVADRAAFVRAAIAR
jgi:predicted ATPase